MEDVPNYAKPNLSHMLYDYTNRDQDLVAQAFRTGNFTYLSSLPNFIQPSAVADALAQKSVESVNRHSKPKPKLCHLWGCDGLVHEFEWMPDSYEGLSQQLKKERVESEAKRKLISGTDFVAPGTLAKDKHEEGFSGKNVEFLTVNEPYGAAVEHANRLKWIQECQLLAGDFKPCVRDKAMSKVNRQHIGAIVTMLKKKLESDWEGIEVTIDHTADDLIEIRVTEASVDSQMALHAYMNVLANQDEELFQFKLKRVTQVWGLVEASFIYYTLAPPWTRLRTNDVTVSTSLTVSKHSPLLSSGARSVDG